MKLATLKNGTRDGRLVVVSADLRKAVAAEGIAATLQQAIDDWRKCEPGLREVHARLNAGLAANAFNFDTRQAVAPLPRSPQWCDGSSFLNHGRLMEIAFKTPPIPDFKTIPLLYQGASDDFLGACDDIPLLDEAHGIDFEGEFGVIVDEVPMVCPSEDELAHIKLSYPAPNPRTIRTAKPPPPSGSR